MWQVKDDPFNRHWYPEFIGKFYCTNHCIPYARVRKVDVPINACASEKRDHG